ncbi:monothiol glutaredoxin-S15, mitochondrial isoform X2 [Diospyros lotus]|uniref:monothiol glutaredoxin-S15, mitochondrial isoform X2 n=1 Tax=Diospyros lotus TaxID=55363 RepID=UPI002250A117|nr:monothiol glutaredoxin-S15, mitochondrial isoform X2 [Diospyros lotus]
MWRRLYTQLHRLAVANVSSSPLPPPSHFRPAAALRSGRSFASYSSVKAAGSFSHHGMQYSTTVPNDPDTHEDFRPTSKLESSGLSLKDIVEQDVKDNPVMIYMKGVPDLPRCGFSSLAVRVLKEYNVPLSARNILEDPELKNAVKQHSHWPTFPQIFINGEFIGGSDIILSMHQSGELKEKLKAVAAHQGRSD